VAFQLLQVLRDQPGIQRYPTDFDPVAVVNRDAFQPEPRQALFGQRAELRGEAVFMLGDQLVEPGEQQVALVDVLLQLVDLAVERFGIRRALTVLDFAQLLSRRASSGRVRERSTTAPVRRPLSAAGWSRRTRSPVYGIPAGRD